MRGSKAKKLRKLLKGYENVPPRVYRAIKRDVTKGMSLETVEKLLNSISSKPTSLAW